MEKTEPFLREYQEINSHLRSNIRQFVNWFSFFLIFSLAAIGLVIAGSNQWPILRTRGISYLIFFVFLVMHILAFVAIVTFRRYISAANRRLELIIEQLGSDSCSPIPMRFCQWMTDLMAAGFVVSYFAWFTLLFIR